MNFLFLLKFHPNYYYMNSNIQNLTMLSAVIAFASCNSHKVESQPDSNIQTETVQPTTKNTNEVTSDGKVVEGIVNEITFGKDGYTATIETNEKVIYQATISRVNLTDPKQYRDLNKNEIVKLKGDVWKMEDENQLTVREIQ